MTDTPGPRDDSPMEIGVSFRHNPKIYSFAATGTRLSIGDKVLVRTEKGVDMGEVMELKGRVAAERAEELMPVVRKATAEDLGHITADVREAVAKYQFPCMRVLQFAFSGDPKRNIHMPHNHIANAIVYTGTHDNNTTRGWFENEMKGPARKRLSDYLGHKPAARDISWELMRVAMSSVARLAVVPMQDILSLGASARMNYPAKATGNWFWRMRDGQLTARLAGKLRDLTATCGRL